ncbi:MAG: hypothetical protein UU51_C0005G0007 [Microgenomates group bacterium GW2011_GWC1_41_20]|uniref:Uncharacterized protein n=6 Tax=Candidatus Woeseibacteriota TaxID=1752722 RepID=A0A0G0QQB0_9BACT|nr:MAG: hypothetical protein UT76_C0023G0008 [Candidatus Woesebacteria bacterium GW2011_GWB1_40_12]KKR90961.1 MAG: hypothetical protein UU39_C0003G0011 [Candidatus Woesebacteria bacterium GW2011_GWD1_41_12]KKS00562.1 MAG: hypothetical protein UU51_C0005G0007 [Microgenomates group bacterium GW2011_GWC1_41_20]KKS05418.1 MAG: hypothetical protein UU57_C0007G0008 [Candidatus Woesebacteria bacterium GW2011_GWE1_41_24]OGM80663.1 MAG: hypothetical protein A2393_01635 [Candidatus Woesebacteria bacteriu
MDTSAVQTAVSLALSGKWDEAITVNLDILKSDPQDTGALCRLARAYYELGEISKAQDTTNKILEIEPANTIAIKFYEKLKIPRTNDTPAPFLRYTESFLEEPGKTKLVGLLNLGEPENFVNLDPGEDVKLAAYSHRVSVTTNDGKYIGRLPDDISAKLKYLIKGGNKYQALIKSVSPKEITVFVRELEKGPGMEGSPSFAPEKIDYVSFTPPELVHSDTPSVETTEEIPEE